MDVAVSLGLYISEKNEGVFKDMFITFSSTPSIQKLGGSLKERFTQLRRSDWSMSTNIQATFELILDQAVKHSIPQDKMPTKVLILSDMQFDQAKGSVAHRWSRDVEHDWNPTAQSLIKDMYSRAGYEVPNIIFWNINSRGGDNFPVRYDEEGTALVSGFSPSIMKSLLGGENMTPISIMNSTVNSERYEPITV
jgi:hypothetical protein